MRNAGLEEAQLESRLLGDIAPIAGRNDLRYADDNHINVRK